MKKNQTLLWSILLCMSTAQAQEGRINDPNTIGWQQVFIQVPAGKKIAILAEYQWRRTDGFKKGQQSLLRAGLQYRVNSQLSVLAGYAWVETFPYGDYPIAANGTFPEHRLFEQLVLQQLLNKTGITHRFRAEQRWLAKLKPGADREITGWAFLHRFRYLVRVKQPLVQLKKQQFYAVLADELFVGAGKQLGINFFDQNRVMALAGFTFNKHIQAEAGYLNQTLQQGRPVNNRAVMQKNNGWLMAVYFNL
jgi:Protein of unknown function (DUF2490)